MGKSHSKEGMSYYQVPDYKQDSLDILYLEDNMINATVFLAYMQKLGLSTEWVNSTDKFFDRLAQGFPRLAVLDVRLSSEIDGGLRVAESLRKAEIHIPIVLLTAHCIPQSWLQSNSVFHLMKPYTKSSLQILRGLCLNPKSLEPRTGGLLGETPPLDLSEGRKGSSRKGYKDLLGNPSRLDRRVLAKL